MGSVARDNGGVNVNLSGSGMGATLGFVFAAVSNAAWIMPTCGPLPWLMMISWP